MHQFKHNLVWPTFRVSQNIYLYSLLPLHTVQRNGFYRCAPCTRAPLNIHSSLHTCMELSIWKICPCTWLSRHGSRSLWSWLFSPHQKYSGRKTKLLYRQHVPAVMLRWKIEYVSSFVVPWTLYSLMQTHLFFSAAKCLNFGYWKS